MPDWTYYYGSYSGNRHTTFLSSSGSYVTLSLDYEQQYKEFVRECERQEAAMEQILQEQAELEEDKKKYPLFFLKEGIV